MRRSAPGGAVAQHGRRPERQRRRPPAGLGRQRRVPDGEDAGVNVVEVALHDEPVHDARGEPERGELIAGDEPVLTRCEPRDAAKVS
jgi:hypothetical protein